jgi:hypothetical protein
MATNSDERCDSTPEEDTSSTDDVQKPDRSNWPTRLIPLSEEGKDEDVLAMTPAERIEMMWPLTVRAWAFKGEDLRGARLQRHVVRVIRRRG